MIISRNFCAKKVAVISTLWFLNFNTVCEKHWKILWINLRNNSLCEFWWKLILRKYCSKVVWHNFWKSHNILYFSKLSSNIFFWPKVLKYRITCLLKTIENFHEIVIVYWEILALKPFPDSQMPYRPDPQ